MVAYDVAIQIQYAFILFQIYTLHYMYITKATVGCEHPLECSIHAFLQSRTDSIDSTLNMSICI